MSSCAVKKNTETVAQYRQRCGSRPLGQIMMSKENTMKLSMKRKMLVILR